MAGMKIVGRIVASFLAALAFLTVGGFMCHPGWCADCFEPHGSPFTYRQDCGFAGGAAFYPIWLMADLLILASLSGWNSMGKAMRI